ncbi:hypothetical protein [Thalassotalea piscium]|uniref:PRTRC genetic system protein B n=1 Tax=Thalassotalea piscium TaxID=1230533 RepID=A0A7X0NGW2_9GAMM|nr:hypothetical protein [Thalassotalea piscium]MBB6543143.1 PRTRC genetic system protein B [Thalassotalea piscium]
MLSTHNEDAVSHNIDKPVIPKFSLVFFCKENSNTIEGVTRHNVKNGLIHQGKSVSIQDVQHLLNDQKNENLTLNNQYVIAENSKYLIWYSPSRKARMWFRFGHEHNGLFVHWPCLLFLAEKSNKKLSIFALGNDNYPTPTSNVYNAPLMNISNNGLSCMGTAKLPNEISSKTIPDVEALIYESNFTHVNHSNTLNVARKESITNKDHYKFWCKKEKSKTKVSIRNMVKYTDLTSMLSKLS